MTINMNINLTEKKDGDVTLTIKIRGGDSVTEKESLHMNWIMDMIDADTRTEFVSREEATIQ